MTEEKVLLRQENLVSLRTAFVLDDGYVASFMLSPRWRATAVPGPRNYGKSDSTYLYRRRRPYFARMTLAPMGTLQEQAVKRSYATRKKHGFFRGWIGYFAYRRLIISGEADIRMMAFTHPPELKLLWADSGHSVALFLDGQPWAFVDEDKNHGYSKGILRPTIGNTWDQMLFEKTFNAGGASP